MDVRQEKEDREYARGRSQRRDLERYANKSNAFKPSPPPKARFLGNRGPRRFCTFCAPALGKRTAERECHQEIARNMNDDISVYQFRRQKPFSFGGR